MTEPDITENPGEWLAGQSTTPPPGPRPAEWMMKFKHGDLQHRGAIEDLIADQVNPQPFEQFRVSHHAPPPAGAVDLIVKTPAPNYLQDTLNQMPMVRCDVLTHDWNEDTQEALVRCYGGCEGFVRYALDKQGYAQVIGFTR